MLDRNELKERIKQLKEEKNAVIVAIIIKMTKFRK